jgi:hypothetical protein
LSPVSFPPRWSTLIFPHRDVQAWAKP